MIILVHPKDYLKKKKFINVELEVLKINQFKYLDYNEKNET